MCQHLQMCSLEALKPPLLLLLVRAWMSSVLQQQRMAGMHHSLQLRLQVRLDLVVVGCLAATRGGSLTAFRGGFLTAAAAAGVSVGTTAAR